MILKIKIIWTKIFNWEYWPIYILNAPVLLIYLWFAIKSRSVMFFANVNPSIPTGGLFGESKKAIFDLLPQDTYPPTYFTDPKPNKDEILLWMRRLNIDFPVICKPDVGERGHRVEIINSLDQLSEYSTKMDQPFLIQDYVDYPLELSIVAYSYPDRSSADITSICYKMPLSVTGDGKSCLYDLMIAKPRARLHIERLKPKWGEQYESIIPKDEVVLLENIGNHCRGSKFIDWNDHYNEAIRSTFVSLIQDMKGVNFGRFDIKCKSEEDFKLGRGYKILEFNGVGGEPAHVYDPQHTFFYMIKSFYDQWKIIYNISILQDPKYKRPSFKEGRQLYKIYKNKIVL